MDFSADEDTQAQAESEFEASESEYSESPVRKKKRIIMNVALTQYSLIKEIGKYTFDWQLSKKTDSNLWDILWTDCAVEAEVLGKMKPFQKINHFPGMYMISRKNLLAKNLKKLYKMHPSDYDFFPKTWLLPAEYSDLKLSHTKNTVYIVKPEAESQGKGIYLTNYIEDFGLSDRYVIQEYIRNPLLLEGLKFDLRLYVLVTGCNPLRIFLHKEGLCRLATRKYEEPNRNNLHKQYMHLTNYAINKNSRHFVFNYDSQRDNVGHKRSLTSTLKFFKEQGFNVRKLWKDIKDVVLKTLCTVQPVLAHTYKACQPKDMANSMCFEILGFDILLDSDFKPWLLEVNHSPSFSADCPIDEKIKSQIVEDALVLLNINKNHKTQYEKLKKQELNSKVFIRNREEDRLAREKQKATAEKKRDAWEESHLGGYEKLNISERYETFISSATTLYEEWTGVRPSKIKKTTERPKRQTKSQTTSKKYTEESVALFERLSKVPVKKKVECVTPAHVRMDTQPSSSYIQNTGIHSYQQIMLEKQVLEKMKRNILNTGQPMSIRSMVKPVPLLNQKSLFPRLDRHAPAGFNLKNITRY